MGRVKDFIVVLREGAAEEGEREEEGAEDPHCGGG